MTVRLPLRISTTCDALLVSLALLPATKKPQNACARPGAAASAAAATAPIPRHRIAVIALVIPVLLRPASRSLRLRLRLLLPPRRRLARDAEQRHRRAHLVLERDLPARRRRQPLGRRR